MAYWDDNYWTITDPRTWMGGGGWRTGSPHDQANMDADRGIDPLNWQLLQAINPLNFVPKAMDTAFGGRATRGVVAGRPREALSVIPGSDHFGLTSPEDEARSHFGVLGDTLLNPGSARALAGLGKIGVNAARGAIPRSSAGLVPEAAQIVPRPDPIRSPNSGWWIPRQTPGAAPRLRPKGNPQTVANPQPTRAQGPQGLPAPAPRKQLEDLDPVRAYEKLTGHWRNPLDPATVPRTVADPGRAVAQGARASKEFGRLSQGATRFPERQVPTYQPPPDVVKAARDPNRMIGTEGAAAQAATQTSRLKTFNDAQQPGSRLTQAMSNVGGAVQNAGSYLLNMLRGGPRPPVSGDRAAIGFNRPPPTQLVAGTPERIANQVRQSMVKEPGSMMDLQRRGTRMYKQQPSGELRGVGGTDQMKRTNVDRYATDFANEFKTANPDAMGVSRAGSTANPGVAIVYNDPAYQTWAPKAFGEVVRHERTHAIGQEAARRGPGVVSKLPAAIRIPQQLQASASPFKQGVGWGAEEAVARGFEKRTLAGKVGNAGGFLFGKDPARSYYSAQIHGKSPAAGALFDALPLVPTAAKGAGAALPGAALLNAIRNGRNEELYGGY